MLVMKKNYPTQKVVDKALAKARSFITDNTLEKEYGPRFETAIAEYILYSDGYDVRNDWGFPKTNDQA